MRGLLNGDIEGRPEEHFHLVGLAFIRWLRSMRPNYIHETRRGKFPWGEIPNDDLGCLNNNRARDRHARACVRAADPHTRAVACAARVRARGDGSDPIPLNPIPEHHQPARRLLRHDPHLRCATRRSTWRTRQRRRPCPRPHLCIETAVSCELDRFPMPNRSRSRPNRRTKAWRICASRGYSRSVRCRQLFPCTPPCSRSGSPCRRTSCSTRHYSTSCTSR